MANNRTATLTITFDGIPVRGRIQTDLDTGNTKWSPFATGVGGIQVVPNLDTIYLESKRNADGSYTPWESKGSIDVFQNLADNNPQINAAFSGDRQKVLNAFYSTPTASNKLNDGRLNVFNTNGAPQTAKTLGIPGATNTAAPAGPGTGTTTSTGTPPIAPLGTVTNQKIEELTKGIEAGAADVTIKGKLAKIAARYPEDIDSKSQDVIIFKLLEIVGRKFTTDEQKSDKTKDFSFGSQNFKELSGSVVLPIQPSITDSNGVEWGGGNLDPLSAYAGRASLNITTGNDIGNSVINEFKQAGSKFKDAFGSYSTFLNIYFAQEAIGATGLLSRATGAVLNPNLELLFSGPTLRTFSFTFKMSPRSSTEAKMVKDIIFFFKSGMAVRKANTGVFLKSPYVFKIEYQSAGAIHKSLNKIKECALLNCDVDYTPDGSYMTFNDAEKTLTSYQLTLRFSELNPIYNDDYIDDDHPIGY